MRKSGNKAEVTLRLIVNKKSNEMSVNILDSKSLNTIKEIPADQLSGIKKQLEEMTEILFDRKAILKG